MILQEETSPFILQKVARNLTTITVFSKPESRFPGFPPNSGSWWTKSRKKCWKLCPFQHSFAEKQKLLLQKCPRNKNHHIWKTNKSLCPCLSNNNNNNKQKYLQNGSFCEKKVSAFISSSTASARSVAKAVARCCGGSSSSCASVALCRRWVARWWKRRKAAASWCQHGGCANGFQRKPFSKKKHSYSMAFFQEKVFWIFFGGGFLWKGW